MSTGGEAIILYSISTFFHKCLHKWVCVRVALTCAVILAWRVLQSNVAHSQRAAHSEAHLTERLGAWTGGDMVSQTNHVNPPLGQPASFYPGERERRCAVQQSHVDIRKAGLSPLWKLNLSAFECVPRFRLLWLLLFTPHSNEPLWSIDYPDCCILFDVRTELLLPTCCGIISNECWFILFVFDRATENLSSNLLLDKRWWSRISNCKLAS